MKVIEGGFAAPKARFAIVAARFNSLIVDNLIEGAIDTLVRHGQVKREEITLVRVPGAYEMPVAVKQVAASAKFDAIVALGAVIRGGTPHFDYVAGECNKGLAQVALEYGIPVAFGVLTVDTIEQAIERAGTKAGNKGAEAALSALEMANVMAALKE